jgi:hypothetical protein
MLDFFFVEGGWGEGKLHRVSCGLYPAFGRKPLPQPSGSTLFE